MDSYSLKISRPCPVELDVDRSGRQFYCDHCQKDVHVLANWPRAEAEAFIAANRGNSVCVSLRRDDKGELLYADSPRPAPVVPLVPASRLLRRWLPEAAAAAGVAAALTACTPHGPDRRIDQAAIEEPCDRPAEGGVNVPLQVEPERPMVRGGIEPPEPPQPRIERGEKPAVLPQVVTEKPTKAPKQPRQPKPVPPKPIEPETVVDGGIDF